MNPVTDIIFSFTWIVLFVFAIRSIIKGWTISQDIPMQGYSVEKKTVTKIPHPEMVEVKNGDELIIHNDNVFFVFEGIGGKANWIFYKDDFGNAYSVVGSDVAYFSETNGDYNESSNNHVAALSDVSPNQQNSIYEISW